MRRGGTQGQPGRNCHACFVARAGAAILCSLPVSRCGTRRTERLKTNEQENGGCSCCRWSAPRTDRKSTRLNSSHGYISYAVFCLKKKNSSTLIAIHTIMMTVF